MREVNMLRSERNKVACVWGWCAEERAAQDGQEHAESLERKASL